MYVPGLLAGIKKFYFFVLAWVYWFMFGNMKALGLRGYDPKLDSKDSTAPICTDSYCFPQRVKLGYITMRRGLKKFTSTGMEFMDGEHQNFDAVSLCCWQYCDLGGRGGRGTFVSFIFAQKQLALCRLSLPLDITASFRSLSTELSSPSPTPPCTTTLSAPSTRTLASASSCTLLALHSSAAGSRPSGSPASSPERLLSPLRHR